MAVLSIELLFTDGVLGTVRRDRGRRSLAHPGLPRLSILYNRVANRVAPDRFLP